MKTKNDYILIALNILSWIIFTGLCVQAGGIISNTLFTLFVNPSLAKSFWGNLHFSSLYNFDLGYFMVITTLMSIVAVLKTILFYIIIKILHHKKLNFNQPFTEDLKKLILNISYLTFGIGIFSYFGINYSKWLSIQNVKMPETDQMGFDGADVWLFMFVILFVISQIFKKGMELQIDNDLTI
jgi:hypothetical protein